MRSTIGKIRINCPHAMNYAQPTRRYANLTESSTAFTRFWKKSANIHPCEIGHYLQHTTMSIRAYALAVENQDTSHVTAKRTKLLSIRPRETQHNREKTINQDFTRNTHPKNQRTTIFNNDVTPSHNDGNPPQQSDFRPQKPQTKGSNSSQDSFQTKSPNNVQRYSTPAEHANRDFPPNSSSAERDNAESKRPASPSSKAMAENAYAQHFGISPDNSPSGSSEDHFLAQEPPKTAEKA